MQISNSADAVADKAMRRSKCPANSAATGRPQPWLEMHSRPRQQVGKTDSTGSYSYCRDGVDVTDPVLNDSAAEYTPGISESRSGTSAFYHADRLGSTTKISNSSDTVTDTRQYDAFGMLLSSTGSNPTPFGFVQQEGYQTDPDSGLMLLGHRYYDPSTGRFLTRDRAMDGRNWYDYCQNGPLRAVDPTGDDWGSLMDKAKALNALFAFWNLFYSGFPPLGGALALPALRSSRLAYRQSQSNPPSRWIRSLYMKRRSTRDSEKARARSAAGDHFPSSNARGGVMADWERSA